MVKLTCFGGSPVETRRYYLSSAWRVLGERVMGIADCRVKGVMGTAR